MIRNLLIRNMFVIIFQKTAPSRYIIADARACASLLERKKKPRFMLTYYYSRRLDDIRIPRFYRALSIVIEASSFFFLLKISSNKMAS